MLILKYADLCTFQFFLRDYVMKSFNITDLEYKYMTL